MSEQDAQAKTVTSGFAESVGQEADKKQKWEKTELTDEDRSFMKTVVERMEGVNISEFTDCWDEIGKILNQEENELSLGHCKMQFEEISRYLKDYSDYNVPYAETFMQIYEHICQTVGKNQKGIAQKRQMQMPSVSHSSLSLPAQSESLHIPSVDEAALSIFSSPKVLCGSSEGAEDIPDQNGPEDQEHLLEDHDGSANPNRTIEKMDICLDQHGGTLSMLEERSGELSKIVGELPVDAPMSFARLRSLGGRPLAVSSLHGKTLSKREERLRKRSWNPEHPVDAPASSACLKSLRERPRTLSIQHGKTLSTREERLWKGRGIPEHPVDVPASSAHPISLKERSSSKLNQHGRTFNTMEQSEILREFPVDVPASSEFFTSLENRLSAVLDRHGRTLDQLHKLLKNQEAVLKDVEKRLGEIEKQLERI